MTGDEAPFVWLVRLPPLTWPTVGWQRVRRAWETQGGCPNFGAICVAVHVPTSLFALLDVLMLRDAGLLARHTPSLGAERSSRAGAAGGRSSRANH